MLCSGECYIIKARFIFHYGEFIFTKDVKQVTIGVKNREAVFVNFG